jgi:hypothetical protein
MSEGTLRQWCRMLKDGPTDVDDEERSDWPSVVGDDLIQSVNQKMCESWRVQSRNFHVNFLRFHHCSLQDYHRYTRLTSFAQDGLWKCSQVHTKCREWLRLWLRLAPYHRDGNAFLSHVVQVTDDETWVSFVNVEAKEQSKHWMHT